MKRSMSRGMLALGISLGWCALAPAQTPLGTAFTYQGQLKNNGSPANGSYDMQFSLWDAASGGNQLGTTQCADNVLVANGLFTVTLDFGAQFNGQSVWLNIALRADSTAGNCSGGIFTPLTQRQALTATPYAGFSAAPWATNSLGITYSGGRVGIGTTTPAASLAVLGGIRARGGPPGASGSNNNGYAFAGNFGDSDSGMFSSLDGQLEFYTQAVERIRIDGTGNVGLGTTSPKASFHNTGDYYGKGHLLLHAYEGDGNNGTAFVQARDDSATSQIGLQLRTKNGVTLNDVIYMSPTGNVGVGTNVPAKRLHVVGGTGGGGSEVMRIENTNTVNGDGLEIKLAGTGSMDSSWNWLTFRKADNSSAGAIQGDGSGGVQLAGPGSDYAEWLPAENSAEKFEPGDIVGVTRGRIKKQTSGATQLMVVSSGPLVLGNQPNDENAAGASLAFVGQAPVKVRGPVMAGQFILADGLGDGIGVAFDGNSIPLDRANMVVGRAWASADGTGVNKVNCLVGLQSASGAVARLIDLAREQGDAIQSMKAESAALRQRLDRLERQLVVSSDIANKGEVR